MTPLIGLSRDDLDLDMVDAILEEAGKLATGAIVPLNRSSDRPGAVCTDGAVKTAKGFRDVYKQYVEGGWNAVPF